MTLRPAQAAELAMVLSWVKGEQECRMWAGPNVRYPGTPDTAWADMEASEQNTYALVDAESVIMGGGQLLLREDGVLHLARLIVDPALRGQGVGRALCVALVEQGASQHHVSSFTLNVYESNTAAFRLYQALGFVEKGRGDSGALAMIKPITTQ